MLVQFYNSYISRMFFFYNSEIKKNIISKNKTDDLFYWNQTKKMKGEFKAILIKKFYEHT